MVTDDLLPRNLKFQRFMTGSRKFNADIMCVCICLGITLFFLFGKRFVWMVYNL